LVRLAVDPVSNRIECLNIAVYCLLYYRSSSKCQFSAALWVAFMDAIDGNS
jgi:hypothetical protein